MFLTLYVPYGWPNRWADCNYQGLAALVRSTYSALKEMFKNIQYPRKVHDKFVASY